MLPNSSNGGFTEASKLIAASIVVLYFFGLIFPLSKDVLSLIPSYTLPPHFFIWNIFTAPYFEISIISVIIDVIAILFIGKTLEPLWGTKEYLKFIVFVATSATISTFLVVSLIYLLSGSLFYWNEMIEGFSANLGAFSVAFKQISPNHNLQLVCGNIPANYIPLGIIIMSVVSGILGSGFQSFFVSLFGVYWGWFYLRFLKGEKNDFSEQFSFASFFPERIRPSISSFSDLCFSIFSRIPYVNRLFSSQNNNALGQADNNVTIPLDDFQFHPQNSSDT